MGKLNLNLIGESPSGVDANMLVTVAERIGKDYDPTGQINLKFASDGGIRKLNRDYSGNDYATDVLSFSYIENGSPIDGVIGEIFISTPTAQRQAETAGITLADEAATLTIHGVLHILGIDHQTADQKAKMDRLQSGYAKQLGVKYRDFDWQ